MEPSESFKLALQMNSEVRCELLDFVTLIVKIHIKGIK
jgi:hypothetical protein